MSLAANWQWIGRIQANDRTGHLYRDTAHVYRVHDADGRVLALGYPTAGVSGDLIAHPRFAPFVAAAGVGAAPFSKEAR